MILKEAGAILSKFYVMQPLTTIWAVSSFSELGEYSYVCRKVEKLVIWFL